MKKGLSPIWFVLIVGAFFLPFVSISCQAPPGFAEGLGELGGEAGQIPSGGFDISVKTLDFVIGGEPSFSGSQDWQQLIQEQAGTESPEKMKIEPFAIAALGLAVLGIFLALIAGRVGAIMSIVLGAGVTLFMFLLKPQVDKQLELDQVPAEASGFLDITYGLGYWGPLILGLVAAAWGIFRLLAPDGAPSAMPAAPAAATGAPPSGTGFESTGAPPPPPPPTPPGGGGPPPQEPSPPA
ncbi:MAG TPA: hypothetical protein VGB28_04245 [Actinomycetota bacterium]